MRKIVLGGIVAMLLLGLGAPARAAGAGDPALEHIPAIDALASAWLDVSQIAQMPSLHNFHDMAACTPDLLGVNYLPDGELYSSSGPRWMRYNTLPPPLLTSNGVTCEAGFCRWYPYQALRIKTIRSLEVESAVRLVFEGRGILYQLDLRNRDEKEHAIDLAILVPYDETDLTPAKELLVSYHDAPHGLSMAYAFTKNAPKIDPAGNQIKLKWKIKVPAHDHQLLEFVMVPAARPEEARAEALRVGRAFTEFWNQARQHWAERWRQAFTPGNSHFSGNMPILRTSDPMLGEIYYRSILTVLTLERTNLPGARRVYVSGGERPPGTVRWGDAAAAAPVLALLDPEGLRAQLGLWLGCGTQRTGGFDMARMRTCGGEEALGGWALFQLARGYLGVTNDLAWLDHAIGGQGETGGQTVMSRLEALATEGRRLPRGPGGVLADYGAGGALLKGMPSYAHCAAAPNAASAWMLREAAGLRERRGEAETAARLRAEAAALARAVLALYVPGKGYWSSLDPRGTRIEQRHCLDFITVGSCLEPELTPPMKKEMVDFVRRELQTNNWMRAQSMEDGAAENVRPPDVGPLGAYDAWPAQTAATMCELGEWRRGLDLMRRTAGVLSEGVFSQAHEMYGSHCYEGTAAIRIAQRQGCTRECSAGGAAAGAILGTLFGFRPAPGKALDLYAPREGRAFEGRLIHVRREGAYYTINAGRQGLTLEREDARDHD